MNTPYTDIIQKQAPNYDPRHVEAFMRCEYSTLDHLTPAKMRNEIKMACLCIDEGGVEFAESVAQSFGF